MISIDAILAGELAVDLDTQRTRDAGRVYQIEIELRADLAPTARYSLQVEHARLRRAA